jgi:VanZ family protein
MLEDILHAIRRICFWLLWPALVFVIWSELTSRPPAFLNLYGNHMQHFIAYSILALLATLGLRLSLKLLVTIPCILILGGLLEYLQNWTVRDPDLMNVVSKMFGVVVGLCLGAVFLHLVEPTPEDYPPEPGMGGDAQ